MSLLMQPVVACDIRPGNLSFFLDGQGNVYAFVDVASECGCLC